MALIDDVHKKLNETYAQRKLGPDWVYRAPEIRPTVQSNQVLALMETLVEEIETLRTQNRNLSMRLGALEVKDEAPRCTKCGSPQNDHPYRHPFVSERK